jgi:hypothetical protein
VPDELDAQLLRRFAEARQPLADLPFVTQVAARLPTTFGPGVHLRALRGVPGTILGGLITGITAPLRLRYAGLTAVAAAAVALWASLA